MSDGSLRSLRFALDSRLVRRPLRTEERVRSLLLTTAARETQRFAAFNLYLTYSNSQRIADLGVSLRNRPMASRSLIETAPLPTVAT
jgi:hypothetical protein